jgi:hypothetical protein
VSRAFTYGDETTLQGKICIGPIIFGWLYVFISNAGFLGFTDAGFIGFAGLDGFNIGDYKHGVNPSHSVILLILKILGILMEVGLRETERQQ